MAQVRGVVESCEFLSTQDRQIDPKIPSDRTITYVITGWTGGCVDGKRDGHGVFSTRNDWVDNQPRTLAGGLSTDASWTTTEVAEGTFVRGERLGLWCTTEFSTQDANGNVTQHPLGCRLIVKGTLSGLYRKEADGRWRVLNGYGVPITPPSYVDAGVLEEQSDRLIADRRAGRASAPVQVTSTTQAFDDLVAGGRLTPALGSEPIDLRSKRVAIVLSSRTLKEFDRFRAMRQQLIDATAAATTRFRADFVASSDPARVLAAIAAGVRPNVRSMVAADDLSVLAEGKADYVLLVDWRFLGDFAYSEEAYDARPPCRGAGSTSCRPILDEKVSLMIVTPAMKIVGQFNLLETGMVKAPWDGRGYPGLLLTLASWLNSRWALDGGGDREDVAQQLQLMTLSSGAGADK